jgi:hypothetical protein
MPFLRLKDYYAQIQSDNLDQIISDDLTILQQAEQAAQAEMQSYLMQRYQTDKVFPDTTEFSITETYRGNMLIEYTADGYASGTTYVANDRVVLSNKIYKSISGSTGTSPITTSAWTYVVADKTLYYAKTNESEYNEAIEYSSGAVVWFDDFIYTAMATSTGIIPGSDSAIWSKGSEYTFTTHYPEETDYWTQGDNRNKVILMYLIDMTLYHLHSRLNPRNVPELRFVRYDGGHPLQSGGAIGWLKNIASGKLTTALREINPKQGKSIRWGFTDSKRAYDY